MKRIHPNLFHDISKDAFQQKVSALSRLIQRMTDNEIITGLMALAAATKDWHTQIISSNLTCCWFPIRIERLQDGFFITATAPEYAQYLGASVLEVGNCAASEAFSRTKQVAAHDNEYSQWYFAAMFFSMPSILNGLHIIDSTELLRLKIQPSGGAECGIHIPAAAFNSDDDLSWFWQKEAAPAKECVTVTTHAGQLPLYWKNAQRFYWFEFLEEYKAVYLGFNMTVNEENESFADFNTRLWAFIDQHKVDRLIIDLRHNLGGDHDLVHPLIEGVLQRDHINQRSHLWVITGPKNVSASSHCAIWFEQRARPTFVGEPTGARPNQYADPEQFRLPNSQLRVMVSKVFWENSAPSDTRQSLEPHYPVGFHSTEYFNRIDPAMEKIVSLLKSSDT